MCKLLYKQNNVRIAFVGFCVFLLAAISTSNAYAATINVDCDESDLLDAIEDANQDASPDTLELASDCVYTLTDVNNSTPDPNGLPVITADLTFNGNNAVIERSSAGATPWFRVMQIEVSVLVHLNNLTLRNGHSPSGAGIFNRGALTLDHAVLTNNLALTNDELAGGAAIYNDLGTVTITESTLNNNAHQGDALDGVGGGAIWSNGTLTISHSQFDANSTTHDALWPIEGGGGAIYIHTGTVMIEDTAFTNNSTGLRGGAIENNGALQVTGSSFMANTGIAGGGIANNSELTVTQGTFSNNTGSALYNVGPATVTESQFMGNSSENGGGIYNGGPLTLTHSEFAGNSATAYGGGVFSAAQNFKVTQTNFHDNSAHTGGGLGNWVGKSVIVNSVFTNNQAVRYGGAVGTFIGTVKVKTSTFSANHANDRGGAIVSLSDQDKPAHLTINKSTFENNESEWGGAVNTTGKTTIKNSAFAYNHAVGENGFAGGLDINGVGKISNTTFFGNIADARGGGIRNSGNLTLLNVTFAKNVAKRGGAIYQFGRKITLVNTILANSVANNNCGIEHGDVIDGGHNLNTDTSCGIGPATKILFDKAGLQDNGGPTKTIGLRPKSPAVDAGDDAVCSAAPVKARDQRGVVRPQGAHCDIGAFELKP